MLLWAVVVVVVVVDFVRGAGLPICAGQCADEAAVAAGCASLLDIACLCASPTFSSSTGRCAFGNCSPQDIVLVEAFLTTLCQTGFSSRTPSGSPNKPSTSTTNPPGATTSNSNVATVTSSNTIPATTTSRSQSGAGTTLTVSPQTPQLSTTVVFESRPLASPSDSDTIPSSGSTRVLVGRGVLLLLSLMTVWMLA